MNTLHRWLDAAARYAPEYGGGLSNHLPMALAALHGLGAGNARLGEFFDFYAQRLSVQAEPAPRARLREAIARDGRHAVLRRVLRERWPGVGAAAFHGLIRTAYAVENGHDGELAAGLAYWGATHLALGPCDAAGAAPLAPADWLAQLAAAAPLAPAPGQLIFERMRDAAASPAHAALAGRLAIDATTLAALSELAMQRYLASRDFTVLHLVTSCHAMRLLLPHADDPAQALRWYAQAYAAAFVASGVGLAAPAAAAPPPPWPEIAAAAVASYNDHAIKLVYSCREEALARGGDSAQRVAALAVAVPSPP